MTAAPMTGPGYDALTLEQRALWSERDPAGYHDAVNAWARDLVEAEMRRHEERQRAETREKLTAPIRWLAHKILGPLPRKDVNRDR